MKTNLPARALGCRFFTRIIALPSKAPFHPFPSDRLADKLSHRKQWHQFGAIFFQ